MTPDWDDLAAFARDELERESGIGHLRPRLLFFHAGQATLYARTRTPRQGRDGGPPKGPEGTAALGVLFEVAAMSVFASPEAAALIVQCRVSEEHGAARHLDPAAHAALLVQRAWTDSNGALATDSVFLPFGRSDDGRPTWREPEPVEEAVLGDLLARAIGHGQPLLPGADLPANGMAYALTKFGHVIGVHPQWRARFGLDEPVAPSMVRPADRRRAELHRRRYRDRRRRAAAATSGGHDRAAPPAPTGTSRDEAEGRRR